MNDVASTASTPGTERRASTSGAVRSSGADTTRSASAYCAAIESFVVWVMTLPAMSVAVTKAVPMTIATPAATRRPMLRRICARVSRNIRRAPPATPSGGAIGAGVERAERVEPASTDSGVGSVMSPAMRPSAMSTTRSA